MPKIKRYKVMRESLYGLYGVNGYYFHDDFLVDGDKIKEKDLLLFSRGIPTDSFRLEGYLDARKSPYAHFTLGSLPLGIKQFICRVIPKYIFSGAYALFSVIKSANYSLFYSIYHYFTILSLPYEKVFSSYMVDSELGHNYHTAMHIPESIICQNYGVKYYLMHWSDIAMEIDRYLLSFLSCDRYLIWGKAHIQGAQDDNSIFIATGYLYKKFIKNIIANRHRVIADMGLNIKGKIISFFDESFGGGDTFASNAKMTAVHFVNFWASSLETARRYKDNTVVIKSKVISNFLQLPEQLKERFLDIKRDIESLGNVFIVDERKWSFIEVIGISDIVITQGMTSSATIALICGVEGLYFDEAAYDHLFRRSFKDKIVFDDSKKLIEKIGQILKGESSGVDEIPEEIIRGFDAYNDEGGIDRFRDVLLGGVLK